MFNNNKSNYKPKKITGRQAMDNILKYIYQELDSCDKSLIQRRATLQELADVVSIQERKISC